MRYCLEMYKNSLINSAVELGKLLGRKHVMKNYYFVMPSLNESWVEFMDEILDEHGSWDTRKNYKSWEQIQL